VIVDLHQMKLLFRRICHKCFCL